MDTERNLRKQLERVPIACPICGQESDSIKSYTLPDITFAFVAYRWGYIEATACSKCMRKIILNQAFDTLIKTNLFWPVLAFPRLAVNMTRCFVKGHSEDVIDTLQINMKKEWK